MLRRGNPVGEERDGKEQRFIRRHARGFAVAGAVGGLALTVAAVTQEDYTQDNYTSLKGVQVERLDIVKDPLTAFARLVHGNWSTTVYPGSVSDVIGRQTNLRGYYVDVEKSKDLNTTEILTPYLDDNFAPGVYQVALTDPQIESFGEDSTQLAYSNLPGDLQQLTSLPNESRNNAVFNAVMQANGQEFWEQNFTMPRQGWYPTGVNRLTQPWLSEVPGLTEAQKDITTMQAADMLRGE